MKKLYEQDYEDSQIAIKTRVDQQKEKLLNLKRSKTRRDVFAEVPSEEACTSRLVQYATDLAKYAGVSIGPDTRTPYFYQIKQGRDTTQLIIKRR